MSEVLDRPVEVVNPNMGRFGWVPMPDDDVDSPGALAPHWVERAAAAGLFPEADWEKSPVTKMVRAAWMPQEGSQEAFLSAWRVAFEVLYEGTRGPGKGLPVDEPVWTPLGPMRIGDAKVGTVVLCPDGSRSKVIGVFPQGQRPTYRLTFDDGATAECDDQHIWAVHVQGEARDYGYVKHRNMLMPEVLRQFRAGKRVHIPTLDRLSTMNPPRLEQWPVDPYVLGLMLGDGCITQAARYVTADQELAEEVLRHGAREHKPDSRNGLRSFGFPNASRTAQGLKRLHLIGKGAHDKAVPGMYLNASHETRLALLQGLMDTDGTADARGYVTFCSVSRKLAENVQHLARSLGAKATLSKKSAAWEVYIQAAGKFELFRLARKQSRVRGYQHDVLRRRVVAIDELGEQETVCIKIDHPLGLFITRDFVVTHNTDALLMDFFQHVGAGHGAEWRGILFRQTYPQLVDIINKSKKWFKRMCPKAKFNKVDHTWTFPDGEQLLLRHMSTPDDYWNYHGHAYPWIAFEELCNWADDKCYKVMMSCSRSTRPGMPRCYRATTNPYGPGHNWVKKRWKLPLMQGVIMDALTDLETGESLPPRLAVHGSIWENQILLRADPEYIQKVRAAARNPAELQAWVYGSWDIVAGGMFDDLYESTTHVVRSAPFELIPRRWKIDRAFDWGSSKPFAVGWFAESNGEPFTYQGKTYGAIKGDTYMIAEWYGWNGQRNEGLRMINQAIGQGIVDREDDWGIRHRTKGGPADSMIFDEENGGQSIAGDMERAGCYWQAADKGPGSRKQGWQIIRKYLDGAIAKPGLGREAPGFFIFDNCEQTIELFQGTPRDNKDLDDVDTESEDHLQDMIRYRLRKLVRTITSTRQ